MQRRHYAKAAEQIKNAPLPGSVKARLMEQFVIFFENDNPKFDRTRFIEACGQTFRGTKVNPPV